MDQEEMKVAFWHPIIASELRKCAVVGEVAHREIADKVALRVAATLLERHHNGAWMPIESAPRDGTLLLLAGEPLRGYTEKYVTLGRSYGPDEEWVGEDYQPLLPPSHWMPRPAPPR